MLSVEAHIGKEESNRSYHNIKTGLPSTKVLEMHKRVLKKFRLNISAVIFNFCYVIFCNCFLNVRKYAY